jgi:hypothetical protein
MATKSDIENAFIRNADDLCTLAEMLGYGSSRFGQLQCNNGAFVSSLLDFFNDNPGAIEAVHTFVMENIDSYDLDEEEEEEEELDEEACPGCGCMPGDSITEECNDPLGCGEAKKQRG